MKINKKEKYGKQILKNILTKENIIFFILWLIGTYIFFQYDMVFLTDGKYYYLMSKCILGTIPFSLWHPIRGFSYPLLLAIFTILFGDNQFGLTIGTYIFYLLFNILFVMLLNRFIKENDVKHKYIYYVLYVILIIGNALLLGFSHTIMTESVMPFFYILTVYICLKWYELNSNEKLKNIVYSVLLILLGIFIWFIKQPYIIAYLTMILITCIASVIKKKSLKSLLFRFSIFILSIVSIFTSVMIWDKVLVFKESSPSANAEAGYMSSMFGGTNFYFEYIPKTEFCDVNYINNLNLSEKYKTRINNYIKGKPDNSWCDTILLYKIVKDDEIKNYELYIYDDGDFSTFDSAYLLIKNLIKNPQYVLGSYWHNYLAISNIEGIYLKNGGFHSTGALTSLNYEGFEFEKDGIYVFHGGNSTLAYIDMHDVPIEADPAKNYELILEDKGALTDILLLNNKIIMLLYKILMFLALPLCIFFMIKFIFNKKNSYFIISLISGATFTNNIFQITMAAINDRYAYPMFPLMILVLLIILMQIKIKQKRCEDKNEN